MSLQTERALFEACIEVPAAERAAWLDANCPDTELRARIAKLLSAHDAAEERGALQTPPQLPPEPQIGPYRLLERIGEGAMGEVYLAEQSTPVLRRVALKVIKPGMDSREVIARFELERRTLALMSHPSIAHIIDAGTTPAGRPYFAMEYVRGIPLTQYCDRHKLGIDERLELFLQICDAVQHAHQKGVIHRDLKPGNLLVADLDGRPVPKVIDFGIAKAVSSAAAEQPSRAHTRIGNLIGTPEYMSPEQAQLSPLDVDTRSDVYSLGVVLHELLTGALPFESSTAGATPAMIVQELLTHDPAAPSARVKLEAQQAQEAAAARRLSQRQLAARLAGDLDWIVLKALEKDRNRRYGSPAEMAADVRRHLADEPVIAGPPSNWYRLRKFGSRHRLILTLAGAAFVAALAFGALMAHQAHEIALQRDEAKFQAQRAEASSEFMSLMLEEVGPAGEPLTPVQLLEKGVDLLDRRYGTDPRFAARMLLQMSRRFMDLGNVEKQEQVLARAGAIARELQDDELLAAVECTEVRSQLDANRYEQAKVHLKEAQAALRRVAKVPVETRVNCLRAEADVAEIGREFETALARLGTARELLERDGATRGLQYNSVLTDLGGVYFRTGRFRNALQLNQQTIEAMDRNGRGGTLGRLTLTVNRASILLRLGEVKRAEATGLDGLKRMQLLRSQQAATPAVAISYSITLNRLGRPAEAIALLTTAREQARTLGNEYWYLLANYHLGRSMLLAGRLDEAQACFEESQKQWRANETANRDRLADLSRSLAELAVGRQRQAAAQEAIDASLKQFGYPTNTPAPGLSAALATASRIYLAGNRLDEAEAFGTDALQVAERIAREPRESADVGEALLVMAQAFRAKGDRGRARKTVERAIEALTNSLGGEHHLTRDAIALRRTLSA